MYLITKYLEALLDCIGGVEGDENEIYFNNNRVVLDNPSNPFRFYIVDFTKDIPIKKSKALPNPTPEDILNFNKNFNHFLDTCSFKIKDIETFKSKINKLYLLNVSANFDEGVVEFHFDSKDGDSIFYAPMMETTDYVKFNNAVSIMTNVKIKLDQHSVRDFSSLENSRDCTFSINNIEVRTMKKMFPKLVASSKLYLNTLAIPENRAKGIYDSHLIKGRVDYKYNSIHFLGKIIETK